MTELTDDQIDAIGKQMMGVGYGGNTDRDFARDCIAADRQLRQGDASMPIFGGEICSKHDGVTSFCIARSKKDADAWESNGFVVNRLVRLSDAQAAILAKSMKTNLERSVMTEKELRAAFAKSYPTAAADFAIFENINEYSLESSAARSRWAAFKSGAEAVMKADRQAADDANAADLARQEQSHTCQLPTTRQALAALEKQQRDERLYRKVHNL